MAGLLAPKPSLFRWAMQAGRIAPGSRPGRRVGARAHLASPLAAALCGPNDEPHKRLVEQGETTMEHASESRTTIDETKLNAFMGKMLADMGAAMSGALVLIGDKLGLYKAMAGA